MRPAAASAASPRPTPLAAPRAVTAYQPAALITTISAPASTAVQRWPASATTATTAMAIGASSATTAASRSGRGGAPPSATAGAVLAARGIRQPPADRSWPSDRQPFASGLGWAHGATPGGSPFGPKRHPRPAVGADADTEDLMHLDPVQVEANPRDCDVESPHASAALADLAHHFAPVSVEVAAPLAKRHRVVLADVLLV